MRGHRVHRRLHVRPLRPPRRAEGLAQRGLDETFRAALDDCGVGGLGATAALLVGGALTDGLGWQWIFFLNLPVAAALLLLAPMLLHESHGRSGHARTYDPVAAITLTAALVLLIYAVVEAPNARWVSTRTIGLIVVAVALAALFCVAETRSTAPLIPLRIFRSRTLVGGNAVMLLTGMAAWGTGLTASLYAQQVLGYSPLIFGLGTAVLTVMAVVGSYAAQAALTRVGVRTVAAAGMTLLGMGGLLLAQVSVDGSYVGQPETFAKTLRRVLAESDGTA